MVSCVIRFADAATVLPAEGERTTEGLRRKLALVALHALLTLRPTQAGSLAAPFARFRDCG